MYLCMSYSVCLEHDTSLLLLLSEHLLILQNKVQVLIPTNSFSKYLLRTYYVLDSKDSTLNKAHESSALRVYTELRADNKASQISQMLLAVSYLTSHRACSPDYSVSHGIAITAFHIYLPLKTELFEGNNTPSSMFPKAGTVRIT